MRPWPDAFRSAWGVRPAQPSLRQVVPAVHHPVGDRIRPGRQRGHGPLDRDAVACLHLVRDGRNLGETSLMLAKQLGLDRGAAAVVHQEI